MHMNVLGMSQFGSRKMAEVIIQDESIRKLLPENKYEEVACDNSSQILQLSKYEDSSRVIYELKL